MKKYLFVILLIASMIIVGCSGKVEEKKYYYSFKGESELWKAEYNVNGTSIYKQKKGKGDIKINNDIIFILTYKNDLKELNKTTNMNITCESSLEKMTWNLHYKDLPIDSKAYIAKYSTSGFIPQNDIIKVIVRVDGDPQIIELNNDL